MDKYHSKLLITIIAIYIIFVNVHIYSKSREVVVQELFSYVEKWLGTPYVYGGNSRSGIDCSAFTIRVYSDVFSIQLPRTVDKQKYLGFDVTGELQPGDLLFFNIGGKISHVGVYVFDSKFIHAASSGPEVGIIKSSLTEKYYRSRFVFAKRHVNLTNANNKSVASSTLAKDSIAPPSNEETGGKRVITEYPDIISFKIGSVVYRGNVRDFADTYNASREIFFDIKNINHDKKYFYIDITDFNSDKKRRIHLFDIKKGNKVIRGFYLPEGNYGIQLKTFKQEVLFEKNIFVKVISDL